MNTRLRERRHDRRRTATVLVFTREGAADRKNGIVIASLEDPLHPKVISEFTEGVTAGVHSAFVYTQPKHGTHVYLTNDGTGALHVIDINDPYKPKEVAQWKTTGPDAGRYAARHRRAGRPALRELLERRARHPRRRQRHQGRVAVEPAARLAVQVRSRRALPPGRGGAGPGFIRGTHTAWRHKNYVFIADEVFPASQVKGAKDESADRMYGTLQVIDVSDIEKPQSVAWYEPEYGGVHNVWVAGDTLYMGAYNGGFRAFDISGELRGDLRAQGREIALVNTADMDGKIQNAAMTWGVVVNPATGSRT